MTSAFDRGLPAEPRPGVDPPAVGRVAAAAVLDGTRVADAEASRLIEPARRHAPTDRVLHAAALVVSATTGEALPLERSRAHGWMLGLAELTDRGLLDAAQLALPPLSTRFPGQPYLEFMSLVFDRLPSPVRDTREPFVDDREDDVQLVRAAGARSLVIAFCGARHNLALPLPLMDRWLALLGSHVVYLRDWRNVGYLRGVRGLGPNLPSTVDRLVQVVHELGVDRIACLGNSVGASGALRYAHAIGADRVLALAPITVGQRSWRKIPASEQSAELRQWVDVVRLWRRGRGARALVLYGADNVGDGQQSQRMAGLRGVTVEGIPDCDSHHLVGGLLRTGRLEEFLGWLVADDTSMVSAARAGTVDGPPSGHHDGRRRSDRANG